MIGGRTPPITSGQWRFANTGKRCQPPRNICRISGVKNSVEQYQSHFVKLISYGWGFWDPLTRIDSDDGSVMNHVTTLVFLFLRFGFHGFSWRGRDRTSLMLHFHILDIHFVWIYYCYDGNSGSTGPAKLHPFFSQWRSKQIQYHIVLGVFLPMTFARFKAGFNASRADRANSISVDHREAFRFDCHTPWKSSRPFKKIVPWNCCENKSLLK